MASVDQTTLVKYGPVDAIGAGVIADGISNASPKIQELLDAASPAAASIEIYFGPGTYRLMNELKIYSNTTITASSKAIFVRDHTKYILMNGNRSSEANPSTATGYTGRGDITISGGIWDGNGVKQTAKASIFHLGHGDRITIQGATFKDVSTSHHIEFNACRNVIVRDCFFLGMVNNPNSDGVIEDYNECIQLDLSKPGVTTIGPADNTPCRQVEIDNCYFGPSSTPGSSNIARGVGSHSSTIGRPHFDINIKNCTVENSTSWGFRAYNWRHVTITDNTLYNCGGGINWRSPIQGVDTQNSAGENVGSEVTYISEITGNSIQGTMTNGRAIEIYGEGTTPIGKVRDVIVSENIIRLGSSTKEAILFNLAESCECVNNRIHGAGLSAITIRNSEDISVNGNIITSAGKYGVEVTDDSTGIIVSANNINKVQSSGVYLGGNVQTEAISVSNNMISGVNGSAATGTTTNHIRITSQVKNVSIVGNVLRNLTGYSTTHGVYVTNTCTDISTSSNTMPGLKLYNAAVVSSGSVKDANGDIHA